MAPLHLSGITVHSNNTLLTYYAMLYCAVLGYASGNTGHLCTTWLLCICLVLPAIFVLCAVLCCVVLLCCCIACYVLCCYVLYVSGITVHSRSDSHCVHMPYSSIYA